MTAETQQEIVDLRMRAHLLADIEALAQAQRPMDLHNPELGVMLVEAIEDAREGQSWFPGSAITSEEIASAEELYRIVRQLWDEAAALKDKLNPGAPSEVDEDLFESVGWLDKVPRVAQATFEVFMKRGWLDEGLWS